MDLMFEYSDLPGREEVVSRIRKLNGQGDPSKKDDPEQMAQAQAQAEEARAQKEFERRRIELELAKMEAEVGQVNASAEKTRAEVVDVNIGALYRGVQTAAQIVTQPETAMVADQVVGSAGYVDKNAAPTIPTVQQAAQLPVSEQERALLQDTVGNSGGADNNPLTPNTPNPPPLPSPDIGGQAGIIAPGAQPLRA